MPAEKSNAQPPEPETLPRAALIRLIKENEDWLMARILHYAKQRGYTRYTSTLPEAWRLSIAGLSASFVSALPQSSGAFELSPGDDYRTDPVAAFGVAEARRHRERGVDLAMFLGLIKYYRQAYLDLVDKGGFDAAPRADCRHVVNRFFDRIEIGFTTAWTTTGDKDRIRELQDANRRIVNEKNKYLTVFESLPIAVILVNDDMRIENMNDAARRLVRNSLQSRVPDDHWEPENADRRAFDKRPFGALFPWLAAPVADFTRQDQPGMYFMMELAIDQRQRQMHVRLSRMLDISDKFRGTLVFLEDVTERIRADRSLKNSEALLRTTLNAIQDGITVLDTSLTILQTNRTMERWNRDEMPLTGKRCYKTYHGRQEPCTVCPSQRVLETGLPHREEVPLTIHGEQKGWLEIHAYPLEDESGAISGVVEYVRNITERKAGESARQESERLRGVLETAGAVGHELNQPLQSVMGQCELMFLDMKTASPMYSRMASIRDQIYKMGEITRKLMSITRYRTKRYDKNDILDIDEASTSLDGDHQ